MKPLSCLVFPVALLALARLPASEAADKDDPKGKLSAVERKILDLTNEAREKEKLPPLKPNAVLARAAREHSANMARQGKMEHVLDDKTPAKRVDDAGYDYARTGENLAYGKGIPVEDIFKAWMQSEAHRKNILGKYEEIGIGSAANDKGEVYYTQEFGTARKKR